MQEFTSNELSKIRLLVLVELEEQEHRLSQFTAREARTEEDKRFCDMVIADTEKDITVLRAISDKLEG